MLQRMLGKEEDAFWHGLNLKMGEELELVVPPRDIQIEDIGQRVWWGPEPKLVQEGLPFLALGAEIIEVEGGTKQVQEDGTMVEDDAMAE